VECLLVQMTEFLPGDLAMNREIAGGCDCGNVRYRITEPPLTQMVCHCDDCLNRTGPYTGIMFVPKDATEISGDCDVYETDGGTGRPIETWRCSKCGGFIGCWAGSVPLMWLVSAPSLDDSSQFKPEFHHWVRSKPDWVTINDNLPQFEKSVEWDKLGGRPDFGTMEVPKKK
jgi:hypothetical protein